MSRQVEALRAERDKAANAVRSLTEGAARHGLTGAHASGLESFLTRAENLNMEIRTEKDSTETRDVAAAVRRVEELDSDIRGFEEREQRGALADELRAAAENSGVPLDARGARQDEQREALIPSLAEYRAMVAAGNSLVPAYQLDRWYDVIRGRSAVLRAMNDLVPGNILGFPDNYGSPFTVPKLTGTSTAVMVGESSDITEGTPTAGVITLTPRKLARFALVSSETLSDSNPNARDVLGTSMQRDMSDLLETQLVAGSGSGVNMRGILNFTSTTSGPSTGTNGGALSAAILADTVGAYTVAGGSLESAAWIVHPRTVNSIRKLADTAGRYLFTSDGFGQGAGGLSSTVFGIPVYISSAVPIAQTVGTSTDTTTLILADMANILIARRRDIIVEYSTDYAFKTDQVAARAIARFDIQPIHAATVILTPGVRP